MIRKIGGKGIEFDTNIRNLINPGGNLRAHNPVATTQTARLEIISPVNNTNYDISAGTASTGPQMPAINAQVRIAGISPDPTPTTRFTWKVEIRFQASTCKYGRARAINDDFQVVSVGGSANIKFPRIRGGELTLIVSADLPTGRLEARTSGLKIRGTNPSRGELNTALGSVILRKLVAQESRQRQFDAVPNGGVSGCPLFSADRLGGVGLCQITDPSPTDDEHWNWKANVARCIRIFNEKRGSARRYPGRVRTRPGFIALVDRYNRANPDSPPLTVNDLPDFDANQLDLDALRCYNGAAGQDQFGLPLHEYRVALDATGNLIVDANPTTGRRTIRWERVPAADRPNSGDPDYVNHVLAQNP